MSTIADYSVFTKAFLASTDVDFSKKYYPPISQENSLRYLAVVPLALEHPLTPREAMNFDWSKLGSDVMWNRVSCRNANGDFIGNIVRVQPGVREGSIRLVAKVAVTASGEDVADLKFNTFVLLRTDSVLNRDLPIAVATISDGYRLHRHPVIGNDPLDDVENANYVSFTINHLNGYTSVDFNPDAYVTYDVTDALSRSIDGLHIAFDTASGDLKLLDKDGNVLDQANLPIKADVIIAEGEEGYKYVKTDVKQDIHAAKAWMPEGSTAWEAVPPVDYTMKHAALVVGNASTPASRAFVSDKPIFGSPISTEPVQFEHVVIDDSIYIVTNKTETNCHLRKVKGKDEATLEISAGISGGQVTHGDPLQSYPILNGAVEVDVIKDKDKDGVTTYVLVGPEGPGRFKAQPISGEYAGSYHDAYSGSIVTFGGSTTASRVFIDPQSGSYPISTEPVPFEHVVIDDSTYMLVDKNGTICRLIKVKGKAEAQTDISNAGISGGQVTHGDPLQSYPILNGAVEVDVIKDKDGVTNLVLVGTDNPDNPDEFRALSIGGNYRVQYLGAIVTSEGSSTGEVLGITTDRTNLYTFDENAETPSVIHNIYGSDVRWLDIKPLTEVPNHTLKYGLEAFVWTVKGEGDVINEPFFNQLNASLLALGFHEGDDIALGTNLSILAPAEGVSPLNGVDAEEYIHGKGNKATREQEVDAQRANAKEELVAWNAQHPALEENRSHGTIIDSSGLDVRNGSIILGCGRVGKEGEFQKVNYGIQMKDRSKSGPIWNGSESLDFTISHRDGTFTFDGNGHAQDLTSSTLLSIESGSYISGAPTCLILARVTCNTESGDPVFTPVRTTAGFSVSVDYGTSSGLSLTIHDYRDNIISLLDPDLNTPSVPAIIEVQALYTHRNAQSETVPAQQMHTYIGEWMYISSSNGLMNHPECSFLCNKIEEWMTAVGLADAQNQDSELYVVIRVY